MESGILFRNARIVDANTNAIGSVVVQDNIISSCDYGIDHNFDRSLKVINCTNKILIPGIVDIQVHFREPGQEYKEDIASGLKSAAAGGITTVVCQPNTKPTIDNTDVLRFVLNKGRMKSAVNLHCYAAVTRNLQGRCITDIKSLYENGAIGFTDDGLPISNPDILKDAFYETWKVKSFVAQHAEDLSISNNGSVNKGSISKKLNDPGIANSSEYLVVKRDLDILRSVNVDAHYHLLHVSTKEAVEEIKIAKKQGLNVTCEATPHHFILNDSAVLKHHSMAKMNPPLRSEEDRLAIIEGLTNGTIDCIATDHAPHEFASKILPINKAPFGIVGLETLLPLTLKLFYNGNLSLKEAINKITYAPAKVINQKKIGLIKKGYCANIAIIDIDNEYLVDITSFHGKSNNSPFHNMSVKGSVLLTMSNGKIEYAKKSMQL
ncbi:Dihydroorotase [Candidatus Xenohaliotis californiensis]|uniref:Dihydroorotase n=1 Tax=Candidatus Xenohaliotis californiensis TaxID=84677 RepID=A0ABP0ERF9_9RICK|nr:Dihydroorotase [Candidatus Xenohaliotis californiensis]